MDELTLQAVQWLMLVTGVLLVFVAATVFTNWVLGWADRHPIGKQEIAGRQDPVLSFLRKGDLESWASPDSESAVGHGNGALARTQNPAA
jgi:hypothetical protein